MVNQVKLAATAKRLIEENGRSVTLYKLNQTPSDVAKPWRGNVAPRAAVVDSATVIGLFLDPVSFSKWGFLKEDDDLLARFEQLVIFAASSFTGAETRLEEFHELSDGTARWRIGLTRRLAPGATPLLQMCAVNR